MMNLHPDPTPETTKSRARLPIVLCVLLCGIAFGAGLFVANLIDPTSYPVVNEEVVAFSSDETMEDVVEEPAVEPTEEIEIDSVPVTPLTIDWIDPALQPTTAFDPVLYQALCYGSSSWKDSSDQEMNLCGSPVPDVTSIRLGTVIGGAYDGRYLEMVTVAQPGMGVYYESYYLLRDSAYMLAPVILDRHARTAGGFFFSTMVYRASEMLGWNDRLLLLEGYTVDTEAVVPELESFEDELADTQGNTYFFTGYFIRLDASTGFVVPTDGRSVILSDGRRLSLYAPTMAADGNPPTGTISSGVNQFYLLDEDGRVLWYDLKVPFFEYQLNDDGPMVTSGLPRILWNDGRANETLYYTKGAVGGCGFANVTRVLTQAEFDALPPMGQVGVGLGDGGQQVPILEPTTYNDPYYDEAFNAVTLEPSDRFGPEADDDVQKTYADFGHPYLYFKDAFGRWIELASIEIIPPVECGKPVIYLYPEQPTNLIVQVAPRGGISYTEPVYRDGWRVRAYPDGRIVNRDDGQEYPYLFWEGRGGVYAPPTSYWVVERADVEPFLRVTLASMNLIESEIADFLEFWLPRMQEAAYYKIGFHDTRVMDELAPLSLSVKPNHTFRILMDYEPFDHWAPSRPPFYLPHANRNGFEVIEWGGVLR